MVTTATTKNSFRLIYLLCEDEGQMTGFTFYPLDADRVAVQTTFIHEEYQNDPRIMSRAEARKLWQECLDSGDFDRCR